MRAALKKKTISIDSEAYDRLKEVRRDDETLSQTIKRVVFSPRKFKDMMAFIEKNPLSKEATDAIEQVVANRSRPRRPTNKRAK